MFSEHLFFHPLKEQGLFYFTITIYFIDEELILPPKASLEKGGSQKLLCKSKSDAYWYFSRVNKVSKDLKLLKEGKTLEINFATIKACGYYFCLGVHEQTKKHFLAVVLVKVYGK